MSRVFVSNFELYCSLSVRAMDTMSRGYFNFILPFNEKNFNLEKCLDITVNICIEYVETKQTTATYSNFVVILSSSEPLLYIYLYPSRLMYYSWNYIF